MWRRRGADGTQLAALQAASQDAALTFVALPNSTPAVPRMHAHNPHQVAFTQDFPASEGPAFSKFGDYLVDICKVGSCICGWRAAAAAAPRNTWSAVRFCCTMAAALAAPAIRRKAEIHTQARGKSRPAHRLHAHSQSWRMRPDLEEAFVTAMRRFDFSSARADLVASTPGRFYYSPNPGVAGRARGAVPAAAPVFTMFKRTQSFEQQTVAKASRWQG